MQLRTVPARHALQWIRGGFALYRRSPQALAANVLMMWLSLIFAGMVLIPLATWLLPESVAPWVAQLPLALLLPALSVGVFNACNDIANGETTHPLRVFSGLARHPRRLLALGGLYYCCSLLALAITALTDDGALIAAMRDSSLLTGDKVDTGLLSRSALILMALTTPVMMANWFAPVLVALRDLSPVKAAFFSFVACWRNLGAFTLFGAALMGVFWLGPTVFATMLTLIHPTLGLFVMSLLPLLLLPVIYSSFYANALDVFPELGPAPEHAPD